ncbi:MAG: FtsW/RodA/SpoVE family cell cycle protein [Oscillospiraceae bacterium]
MFKKITSSIFLFFKELDKILLLICICASTISVLALYSFYKTGALDSPRTLYVQVISTILGVIIACIISRIDYDILANLWKFHVPLTVLLVILTFFIGVTPQGTDDKAWIDLGFTTFQPSELLKLSFVLTFALHLSKVSENINSIKPFLLLCLHGAIPTLLIVLQGDLGSALVFLAIFIFMMFSAGLSWKLILIGLGSFAAAAPFVWIYVLPPYLKRRFIVALDPALDALADGLQQFRGMTALGAGGLLGRGMFSENLFSVPKAYNDFIFSYIGQIFGFVGAMITLLIITLLCVKILLTARKSRDKLGMFICVGVFSIFMFQSVINIGMVLCFLPVIGITLPFFSAGGTSVLVSYMAIGMVLSVYRGNRKVLLFD